VDSASVREWQRKTYWQLAKAFEKSRTEVNAVRKGMTRQPPELHLSPETERKLYMQYLKIIQCNDSALDHFFSLVDI
jgi:hypothetical protein